MSGKAFACKCSEKNLAFPLPPTVRHEAHYSTPEIGYLTDYYATDTWIPARVARTISWPHGVSWPSPR
ncbi:hypothetical protein, partial [Rhodococcoides fascians]|uniref:hypothetical protein n=1 Tax=Rhodococcoides fascians TaxID=1828 RepID=UPI001E3EF1F8